MSWKPWCTGASEEVGRDVMTFRREDGVAENFRTQQNRELLEKLATETHGKYYNRRKRHGFRTKSHIRKRHLGPRDA